MGLGDLFKSKDQKAAEQAKRQQAENELTQKLANSSCLKGVLDAFMTNEEHEWLRQEQGSTDNLTRYIEVRPDCIIFEWADYPKYQRTKKSYQKVEYDFHNNGFAPLEEVKYGSHKTERIELHVVCRLLLDLIGKNIAELIPGVIYTNNPNELTDVLMTEIELAINSGYKSYSRVQYTLPKKKLESIF